MSSGIDDISFNSKRNIAALLSKEEKRAYVLFDCSSLNILRSSEWLPFHHGKTPKTSK